MSAANNQTCANCKYWLSNQSVNQQIRNAAQAGSITPTSMPAMPGFCVLNAPVKTADGLRWPVTGGQDFCGQWTSQSATS